MSGTTYNRRPVIHTHRIEFSGGYDDWFAKIRTNVSLGTLDGFGSDDASERAEAIAEVTLEHNFLDTDGNELPNPLRPTDVPKLPLDFYLMYVEGINDAITGAAWFPKSKATPEPGKTDEN